MNRSIEKFRDRADLPDRCCWNCRWKHIAGGMLYCRKHPALAGRDNWDPFRCYDCWQEGKFPFVLPENDTICRKWKIFVIDMFGEVHFAGFHTGPAGEVKAKGEYLAGLWEKKHKKMAMDVDYSVVAGVAVRDFVPDNSRKGVPKDD